MGWPRGEATDCKSVYRGSNPLPTSFSGSWRADMRVELCDLWQCSVHGSRVDGGAHRRWCHRLHHDGAGWRPRGSRVTANTEPITSNRHIPGFRVSLLACLSGWGTSSRISRIARLTSRARSTSCGKPSDELTRRPHRPTTTTTRPAVPKGTPRTGKTSITYQHIAET